MYTDECQKNGYGPHTHTHRIESGSPTHTHRIESGSPPTHTGLKVDLGAIVCIASPWHYFPGIIPACTVIFPLQVHLASPHTQVSEELPELAIEGKALRNISHCSFGSPNKEAWRQCYHTWAAETVGALLLICILHQSRKLLAAVASRQATYTCACHV